MKPAAAVDLLPSAESDQNGEFAATAPVATNDVSRHLIELLSNQQQALLELKNEQRQNFEALQNQMLMLKASVVEEQKTGFAEMKIEHRILINCTPCCIMQMWSLDNTCHINKICISLGRKNEFFLTYFRAKIGSCYER